MNKELSFKKLWKVFADAWWKLLLIMLAAMIAMGLFTQFFIQKKYSSSVTFYIINSNTASDYTTTSLLSATEQLANDYTGIILSDIFLKPMTEELKEEGITYAPKEIRQMVSSSVQNTSSLMTMKVTNSDPEHALKIATYIQENAPILLKEITKKTLFEEAEVGKYVSALSIIAADPAVVEYEDTLNNIAKSLESDSNASDCLEAINYPQLDEAHDSPNLMMNVLLAGVGAAVLAYAVFAIISLSSTTIANEEDLKEIVKCPVIGVIPTWSDK